LHTCFYRRATQPGRVYGAAVCYGRDHKPEAGWFLHNPNNQPTTKNYSSSPASSALHATDTPSRGSNRRRRRFVPLSYTTPRPGICISFSDKEFLRCYNSTRLVRRSIPCRIKFSLRLFYLSSVWGLSVSSYYLFGFLFGLLGLCCRPWPSGGVDSLLLGNSAEISGFGESPPVLAFLNSMVRVAGRKKGSCLSEVDFVGGIRGNSLLGVNSALLESS